MIRFAVSTSALVFLVIVAPFVNGAAAFPSQRAERATFRIQSLDAMPYYTQSGTIRRSTSLFDDRLVLRNVGIGSPTDPDPLDRATIEDWDIVYGSTVTYIEVTVLANRERRPDDAAVPRLELLVRGTKGRVVERRQVDLAHIGSTASLEWRVPFFVYGTGCEELAIAARLDGPVQAGGRSLTKTIRFRCGE